MHRTMRNISGINPCSSHSTHFLFTNLLSGNRDVFEIMSNNCSRCELFTGDCIIGLMSFACLMNKLQTHTQNIKYYITYMSLMVRRTRLNVCTNHCSGISHLSLRLHDFKSLVQLFEAPGTTHLEFIVRDMLQKMFPNYHYCLGSQQR